ncbi:MAG: DUF4105 domain-containing protein [Candidatus Riflebacteria bacterium]|nr:DUF4105 domain-containing protein [Candidatus Riflebacteria bacterium]
MKFLRRTLFVALFVSTAVFGQVPYNLTGVLTTDHGKIVFHTEDGRVFRLVNYDLLKASPFIDKRVNIEGKASQATEVNELTVTRLAPLAVDAAKVQLPPMQDCQLPAKILSKDAGGIVVGNVRWGFSKNNGKLNYNWEKAKINPDLIKSVYFIKQPFPPEYIAAHSFFLFTFQNGGLLNSAEKPAQGLVLSIEAFLKKDQPYDLLKGTQNKFAIVWQLSTWEDYAAMKCGLGKSRFIPYEVLLTPQQKKQILVESLKQAAVNRAGEFYHTITNNCTNNLVILMNQVLPPEKRINMWAIPSMVYNFKATMPIMVPDYLQKKNLLSKEKTEINSTNFFGDFHQLVK